MTLAERPAVPGLNPARCRHRESGRPRGDRGVIARVEAREVACRPTDSRVDAPGDGAWRPTVRGPGERRPGPSASGRADALRVGRTPPGAAPGAAALRRHRPIASAVNGRREILADAALLHEHRLPHQLQQAPQAFVPPDPARRSGSGDPRGTGGRRAVARYHAARRPRNHTRITVGSIRALRRRVKRLSAIPPRDRRLRPRPCRRGRADQKCDGSAARCV